MNWAVAAAEGSPMPTGLTDLIDGIGNADFGQRLLGLFQHACGADGFAIYHMSEDAVRDVAAEMREDSAIARRQVALYLENQRWRRDPMIAQARQHLGMHSAGLVQASLRELPRADFRDVIYDRTNICDRVLLCGRSAGGMIGLSIVRTAEHGAFTAVDMMRLTDVCSVLMSIVGKHVEIVHRRPKLTRALTSLEHIHRCLNAAATALSPREAEVCARILYGMSFGGIAIDLGIGEETVVTYRKRAYDRLGIATQRELLIWYVNLWDTVQGGMAASVH
jgi:DNA-binding CsgD family transcriptional regulator